MASWDVALTMGVDTDQLEKSLQAAGRSIDKNLKKTGNPPSLPRYVSPAEKAFTAFQGGGIIGLAGMALGLPGMVVEAVNMLIDGVKKLMDEARRLRNLSIETGLSFQELASLNNLAETSGLSLETLAHSMAEFNKNMGRAKIAGSEVNALLAKLGVGLTDLSNGTFKYRDAIKALAASHRAGTDQATLMYYAVQLFGSSAEQILTIIKGSEAQRNAIEANTLRNSDNAINAMARLSDNWTIFWNNLKTLAMEGTGIIVASFQSWVDKARQSAVVLLATIDPKKAGRLFLNTSVGMTDQQRIEQSAMASLLMSANSRMAFLKEVSEGMGLKGKKLTPFGLSEAQGASSIQRMGGGDIITAIAFTPLERIATATEQTAKNTENMKPGSAVPESEIKFNPNLGF